MLLLLLILSLCFVPRSFAEEDKVVFNSVSGKIVSIQPQTLAVSFSFDPATGEESEMHLTRNEDTRLRGRRKWELVNMGDEVTVDFSEIQKESQVQFEDGRVGPLTRVLERRADIVTITQKETARQVRGNLAS